MTNNDMIFIQFYVKIELPVISYKSNFWFTETLVLISFFNILKIFPLICGLIERFRTQRNV